MKNFIKIIALLSLSACSDRFISLAPISNLSSAAFYKTPNDMDQAVLAAYSGLRLLYNSTYITIGEIRSDNTTYSWLAGNPANEKGIDEFASPLFPENSFPTSLWNDSYRMILRCNIVINRIEQVDFADDRLKNQYRAEARFLRGLTYFWLARAFGGTALNGQHLGPILVDKEITPSEAYNLGRSSLEDCYNFIVEDLLFAESNLPASFSIAEKGRVTNAAASALLGKVYMTMAGYPLKKGDSYYTMAIQKFLQVINNGSYSLVPSYKDLFDVGQKNSSESLFEVQYLKGSPDGAAGSPWNNDFAPRFSDKEVVLVGRKAGKNAPTQSMSNAYEEGDPRKYVSMRDGWINSKTGRFENEKYVCKYYDIATSEFDNGNNWIELRLADIYLLYAEALVRTNGSKLEAITYVNKIRERARNTPGDPDITKPENLLKDYREADFSTTADLLLAIEQERRVELAFENHRWFDLVRTERAKDVIIASQHEDGYPDFTWSDDALAYPIPMTVMQSNPQQIIQNNGYTQM